MVNTILKEADLFCPNSVRINFTIYQCIKLYLKYVFFRLPTSEYSWKQQHS
ncbi:Aspartate aminotransferase [Levilactobacillus zymae]|uniref:Aspartate aminotransferase n=1 Tax=Levilactobacillus zymae TaxID=267363 RepID=A0A1Y6JVS3_9LACO|nr:Aspartate aminotransferase [Levilactobacillus zymae]